MDKARILLADDHAVVREGLRNALQVLPDLEIVGEVGNGSWLRWTRCSPNTSPLPQLF